MGIVLLRVDERLIHGQVVVGWGSQLRPDHYVVVDDDLAGSAWEQDLYELALPPDVEASFITVADAKETVAGLRAADGRTVILMRSLVTAGALASSGVLEGLELNLGGLHHREGCKSLRGYLHLDDEDRVLLTALSGHGVSIVGQDLPSSPRVSAKELIGVV